MKQTIIDGVIDEWRAKLTACAWAKVGRFEQLL